MYEKHVGRLFLAVKTSRGCQLLYLHIHIVRDIQTLHCLFVVFPCQCLYIAHFYKLYMFTKASFKLFSSS